MPDQPAQEKTEKATPKKIRDARKKGQVSKSQDVTSTIVLAVAFFYLGVAWTSFLPWFQQLITLGPVFYLQDFEDAMNGVITGVVYIVLWMSIPMALTVAMAAAMANFFQVGAVFSFETVKPNLNKLNPIEGAKKIFSMKNVFEFIKSLLKVVFLSILVGTVLYHSLSSLINLPYAGVNGVLVLLSNILFTLAVVTILAYMFFAFADFFFQRWQYAKQLRMTKDEVKREYKETEGDPMIKGKRKQLAKEIAMNEGVQNTKKASVVVTNPTHYAVALHYEKGKTKLPRVVAKGEGYMAKAMIKAAEEANVPIMRNVPLAQALHRHVHVDQYIPSDLIEPVAEVLRYIQRLRQEKEQAQWSEESLENMLPPPVKNFGGLLDQPMPPEDDYQYGGDSLDESIRPK